MLKSRAEITGQITPRNEITGQINTQIKVITPTTQEKEITPTKEVQEVIPDENVFALSKVKVNPIPDDYVIPKVDTKTITLNGTYNASDDNLDGYSNVIVETESRDLELEESYKSTVSGSNVATLKLPDGITKIKQYAYYRNYGINTVIIPASVTSIDTQAFYYSYVRKVIFNGPTTINTNAFSDCTLLKTVIFQNITTVPKLGGASAFYNTPIRSGTGFVYVPDDLLDSFKSASIWSSIASAIKPISEYVE